MFNVNTDVLNNPSWFALNNEQAHLGYSSNLAALYYPDVAPFAGLRNFTSGAIEELGSLISKNSSVLLQSLTPLQSIKRFRINYLFDVLQMVHTDKSKTVDVDSDVIRLSLSDVNDMIELAQKTNPGPFGRRTHEMGNYIGIRDKGDLVAMAGERIKVDKFIEISAVCVDEKYRGKGLASQLINTLIQDIYQQKRIPFLHVRSDAPKTVALYEKLGFLTRETFGLYLLSYYD